MTTLDKILDFKGGERFYRIGNADGKFWVVPVFRITRYIHRKQIAKNVQCSNKEYVGTLQ